MRCYLYVGYVVVEEQIAELSGDAEFRQASPRFLRQVVGHLYVDMVGRRRSLSRPAFLDDLDQLRRDVDAPAVIPAIIKPSRKLLRRVVIHYVHVKLALLR